MRVLCIEKNNLTDPNRMQVWDWYQYGVSEHDISMDEDNMF